MAARYGLNSARLRALLDYTAQKSMRTRMRRLADVRALHDRCLRSHTVLNGNIWGAAHA